MDKDENNGLILMIGSYLQGYNMDYQAECVYNDLNGKE
jgi:hypothetical protein